MGQQASLSAGGSGSGTGKVSLGSLQITKQVDVASPEDPSRVLQRKTLPVTIVSVHPVGGSPPMETLVLSYANIETPGKPLTTIDTHPMMLQPVVAPTKRP